MYCIRIQLRVLFLFAFALASGQQSPPNIILMIGDGTGLSQITAGMYDNGNTSNYEEFPIIGLQKTHSSNALVTDSAASGTAMACGVKTLNGVVGIDANNMAQPSILERCDEAGYTTGLIATSSIVHATPASFYAKVISRKQYQDIALQLSESQVDYFIGGGKKHFTKRKDDRNLIDEMTDWTIVSSLRKFNNADSPRIGLFTHDDEPAPIAQGRKPKLNEAVDSMLDKLTTSERPFFLMVEGSQIDWGGHANDLDYVLTEFADFNKAIGRAIAFVKENPNTLLVVTADHETGGLGLSGGNIKTFTPRGGFVTLGHTASMIPVFAMGKGAASFAGIYENTAIFDKMLAVLQQEENSEN